MTLEKRRKNTLTSQNFLIYLIGFGFAMVISDRDLL